MIIINGFLNKIQGLTKIEIKKLSCVSCGIDLINTTHTELYFSHEQRVILLCKDCYNEMVLRINKKECENK